ncbi:two-partner secretion domain-containing protein [Allocoleopsis franciscana]|uniref:Filamentous hemagglutinin family N-terminal domain protein n=1 Tax=Allocoleopsis franciscana PCC 7113 TaxID=1173027 RepID=K9WER0_9CYAN|nr:filamentous hemagglutinin N-terminal domain-containing protein [Allocoleopsis franciscana]AFZ18249.1 filamentous hemagglutinin family N-terminal domain protein [Allocoleopsis franciscana PCC 7113]
MIRPVFRFWRAGYLLLGCLATASSVQAQIVPDDTLPVNSWVTPGCTVCTIDGGTHRGVNLFHSFSEFSVPTGGEAFFNNALQIQNIFSRVTGNSVSNIDGLLRANGTASLFFLNPNGVIFGQNARLEIGGSFFATTGNSFKFSDGSEFSAIKPQAPPLLTINVTPGVQWGTNQPGATITNRGNLAVGQDLTLAAGNLDLQGQLVAGRNLTLQATDTVKVRDSSTSPFIASSGGTLLVQGNQKVDIFALNHPDSGLFSGGNMVLRSANTLGGDAHYWSGGSFRIEKLDGSLGDLYSPNDPIIRSLGDVSFDIYQGTSLHILAGGEVNIGTVIITGAETGAAGVDYLQETVPLSNGSEVSINGRLQPTLDIRAGVDPAFIGVPGITGFNFPRDRLLGWALGTNTPTSANITIGDVWIVPPNGLVFITNQYQPNTTLPGGDITITGAGVFGDGIDASSRRGNGGSVILDSRRNIGITNSGIDSFSEAGNAGSILLNAKDTISLTSSFVTSATSGGGKGGDVTINAGQLLLKDGSQILVGTLGAGIGGNLIVNSRGSIVLTNSIIDSSSEAGNAGSIFLNAKDTISLTSSFVASQTFGAGKGGDVTIKTGQLLVRDGSQILVDTFGVGTGGNLVVNASESVQLNGVLPINPLAGSSLSASTEGTGKAGNITITTPSLHIQDGGRIIVSTEGAGDAGSLTVNASESVEIIDLSPEGLIVSALFAQANRGATGNAGDLTINTKHLLVRDGAQVAVSNLGTEGAGGILTVNASESVEVIGIGISANGGEVTSGLFARTEGAGDAKDLTINTRQLIVQDGAEISASTKGAGDGGDLIVNASESIQLIGESSGFFTQVNRGATGNAGDLTINTKHLLVRDGAQVSSGNLGEGNGGNLIVNAFESVKLIGTSPDGLVPSGLFAVTKAVGDAGDLMITTPTLLVQQGAWMSAFTSGVGSAGSILVKDANLVLLSNNSGISTESVSAGLAGDVTLDTQQLILEQGSQLTAATVSSQGGSIILQNLETLEILNSSISASTETGTAGNIVIGSSESVQLYGVSRLSVEATEGGTAGDIIVKTNEMSVTGGAQVTVSSPQGQAGNLSITANSLTLNRGTLSAVTGTSSPGGGANITLSGLDFLRMDNESLISASALNNANGGNVTIDSTLIVATPPIGPEGSDIIANAEQGNGGRVNITTQGLFGIQFRPQRTPKNDITVSSTFGLSGTFALNTPGVDPSRGLAQLPTNLVDASQQIDQRCTPKAANQGGSFTVTGRGGIPPSPNDTLQAESLITPNWVILDFETENNTPPAPTTPSNSAPKQLVEAQGWRINEQGQVVLTASAPNVTPHHTWQTPVECPAEANPVPE